MERKVIKINLISLIMIIICIVAIIVVSIFIINKSKNKDNIEEANQIASFFVNNITK